MELSSEHRAWAVQLYDENVAAIHAYLARRLGAEMASDLVADVFEAAFGGLGSFDAERGSERAWLFGIAHNLIRRHWRTEERRLRAWQRVGQIGRQAIDPLMDVPNQIDARDDATVVMEAIADLEPDDRDLLLLVAWENVSYAECAQVMQIPVGTVRSRLHRIRTNLRRLTDTYRQEVGQ